MKKLEYGYFTIYYYFSTRSYFPDSLSVRMQSMYMLALATGGWILLLQQIVLRFIRMAWFSSPGTAMINALSVYTAITIIFYHKFILEEKDQKIYDKHVDRWNSNSNKKRDIFIAFFLAVVPYLSMFGIKIFLMR